MGRSTGEFDVGQTTTSWNLVEQIVRQSAARTKEYMLWTPDAIAEIELLRTEDGGRQTAISVPQYGCPLGIGDEYFDCRVDLTEVGEVPPGGKARVSIKFLHPESVKPLLKPGVEFTLWEGRTIGRGRFMDVF